MYYGLCVMKLFCKQYSEAGECLIILHGLFGNQGNWSQHAKLFANTFAVYGMDHRNHGRSEWGNGMSYDVLASDVANTMALHGINRSHFIGHSMGGKTAMQLALTRPDLVDKLVIVDIAPVTYAPHHTAIFEGLDLLDLDLIEGRADADEVLCEYVEEKGVRDFLLANLIRDDEGNYTWRMNLEVIEKGYDDLIANVSGTPYDGDVLFIRGADSDYILKKHENEIFKLFTNAQIEEIADAGHWVHAQQPELFQSTVYKFLKS